MESRELALPRTWVAITSYKREEEWCLHRSSLYISDESRQSHLAAAFNLKRNYKQIDKFFFLHRLIPMLTSLRCALPHFALKIMRISPTKHENLAKFK